MNTYRQRRYAMCVIALAGLFATPAFAYVGPGAGLGFIGTVFGLIAAILLAMVGLFWYPLKRMLGKKRTAPEGGQKDPEDDDRT